jgi:hypothetical protein
MKKWKLVALHIDQIRLKNVQSGHPTWYSHVYFGGIYTMLQVSTCNKIWQNVLL